MAHAPKIHPQMASMWGKYLAHGAFFWHLWSDFDGFWMPGLGTSPALLRLIVWTSGYLRSYTDLKSIHKWPQHGAKLLFNNHFLGNLRSIFNGFWMPGVGMSQAQCKSIVWTWSYLIVHTDLKSTHKWSRHGANTWHMRHFSGISVEILTNFGWLGLGWVTHSLN